MMQIDEETRTVECKHFPVDLKSSFAQFEISMTEQEYDQYKLAEAPKSNKGKVLIQCLDQSGSMSGTPYEAVKLGASKICETILGNDQPFERFITYFYESSVHTYESKNKDAYVKEIKKSHVRGGTNFCKVFDKISHFIESQYQNVNDLTVIFFTDGQAGNSQHEIKESLAKLQKAIQQNKNTMRVRFLTIGFSSYHDAAFLNKITQQGTVLGNFFYVETRGNYSESVQKCLSESLEIAMDGSVQQGPKLCLTDFMGLEQTLPMEVIQVFNEDEEVLEIKGICLSAQTILSTKTINTLQVVLDINENKIVYQVNPSLVESPLPEVSLKAKIMNTNQLIFDLIQSAQGPEMRTKVMEELQELDQELNVHVLTCQAIREKDIKKDLMEKLTEIKKKVAQVMSTLRSAVNGNLSNEMIAQLNDCAYKAIRKQGIQKKLDERALKNEQKFKENDAKLKELAAQFDEASLRKHHADLIKQLGDCPITQCDVVELMKSGDCMGLCLQISRSEAVINDPSKLIIKHIVPTFMSVDSFLESSIFKLGQNQDASGGFDYKKQGELALGVGRESVSGLMPLWLFREHKKVNMVKMQPLYGFMCCLDPMGYSTSQSFTIPYLVLLKAMEDCAKNPSELNKLILKLVTDTCCDMIASNENHKQQIIEKVNDFVASPTNRTADVVASIQLLTAQVTALTSLEAEKQTVKGENDEVISLKDEFLQFAKLAIEELCRRMIKKDEQAMDKDRILHFLIPKHVELVQSYKNQYQEQLCMALKVADSENAYDQFQHLADQLRSTANGQNSIDERPGNNYITEEVKIEDKSVESIRFVSKEEFIAEVVASKPWLDALSSETSPSSKLLSQTFSNFKINQRPILECLTTFLKKEERIQPKDLLGSEKVIQFAILLQNSMQSKNSVRVEAVKNGTYKQIQTVEDADSFLREILAVNLETEILSIERECKSIQEQLLQKASIKLVLEAPDVYMAAAVMIQESFFNGKGDRAAFIEAIMQTDPSKISDLAQKLTLITTGQFQGHSIYKDKWASPQTNLCKQTLFRLWLHLCRINKAVDLESMIALAPHLADKFRLWDKCVGANGKVAPNAPEYREYMDEREQEKQMNALANQSRKKLARIQLQGQKDQAKPVVAAVSKRQLPTKGRIQKSRIQQRGQMLASRRTARPMVHHQVPVQPTEEEVYLSKTMPILPAIMAENPNYQQHVGSTIYDFVKKVCGDQLAPKITGMLIDLPISEIHAFMQDYDVLLIRIEQAKELLAQDQKVQLPAPRVQHQQPVQRLTPVINLTDEEFPSL